MIHCAFAGRADRRWNHYEEGTESPLLQVKLFKIVEFHITQPVWTLFLFKSIWTHSQGCQKIRIFIYKYNCGVFVKFIYSEKATKFCEIFPLLLTVCTIVKSKGTILQNFVAFSEYMNFNEQTGNSPD